MMPLLWNVRACVVSRVCLDEITVADLKGKKRYHLVLPEDVYEQVKVLAEQKGLSVVDVLRKFIQLGIILSRKSDSTLVIREKDNKETLIVLI